jgi:hypothetical protein
MTVKINNLPTNYTRYSYIVAREVEGELWFWGAWYSHQKAGAARQASEVGGIVVEVPHD